MADVVITVTLPDLKVARILKGFCAATGYQPVVAGPLDVDNNPTIIPNPVTRKAWALDKIREMIVETAKQGEMQLAAQKAQSDAEALLKADPINGVTAL